MLVRGALGLTQRAFAAELRGRGGRASRETVSHWENVDSTGIPRARTTKRNAAVIAELARERLGLAVDAALFFEAGETAWDALERRQLEMGRQLDEVLLRLRSIEEMVSSLSSSSLERKGTGCTEHGRS